MYRHAVLFTPGIYLGSIVRKSRNAFVKRFAVYR